VEILDGEPKQMTVAERDCLQQRDLSGVRLSCQVQCKNDMTVRLVSRLEGSGRQDSGSPVDADLPSDTVWVDAQEG
ncbi:MAG TPA: (2Fe-2S)-binding protein, partial [Planctomycetaceae bacterium]|nr:(2Fe-2S)-binding protein [Planctomycetaceae bacterium]